MTFLETLTSVLTGQPEIDGLPMNNLTSDERGDDRLERPVNRDTLLKIIRLQTLIYREGELLMSPSADEAKEMGATNAMEVVNIQANFLGASEDSKRRIDMLRWLIVELIREEIPEESNRFDVYYFAHFDRSIWYMPIPSRLYFD